MRFGRHEGGIGIGARVAFDAAADAVQEKVKGGELCVGFDDFPNPPRIEDEGVFARQLPHGRERTAIPHGRL